MILRWHNLFHKSNYIILSSSYANGSAAIPAIENLSNRQEELKLQFKFNTSEPILFSLKIISLRNYRNTMWFAFHTCYLYTTKDSILAT